MPRKYMTFIQYMNKKYSKDLYYGNRARVLTNMDDYIMWLWYEKFKKDDKKYYEQLEDDLIEYGQFQDGEKVSGLKKFCE